MVDAESIIDLIPSKQKRLIPKLGDTNGAYRFESCPDCKWYRRTNFLDRTQTRSGGKQLDTVQLWGDASRRKCKSHRVSAVPPVEQK